MSLDNEFARKDNQTVRTFARKVNSVCFGGDIRARQFKRSIGGLLGQGCCVERLSLHNIEAIEIFFMLICDDFILLFPKRPQVRTSYVCLCIQQRE